jgi:MFS family permease
VSDAATGKQNQRLFLTCFAALVATSFGFVLRALVIQDWGVEFALTGTQKGELLGVGLWPFAISIGLFSLVIDRIGYRMAMWFAFLCHLASVLITVTATGYWSLYCGTFIVALGNGAVEAAVNPAIASAYRHEKTRWLNRLHAGWPGGLVLGGLLALAVGSAGDWRLRTTLILLPTAVYGWLLLRQDFPVSERVEAGASWREMLRVVGVLGGLLFISLMVAELGRVFGWSLELRLALIGALTLTFGAAARSLGSPLYLALLLLMIPLATTELGTDSWITDLLTPQMAALGFDAGWILVWTSLLMVLLRLNAGPFVRWLSPLGLLAASGVVAAIGLGVLANAAGAGILVAATIYGIGKAFFWPTILGVVAERFPRGGALALNTVAGVGMLAVGIVGAVLLGQVQDTATTDAVRAHDAAHGTALAGRFLTEPRESVLGDYTALDAARLAAATPDEQVLLQSLQQAGKQAALGRIAYLPAGMALGFGLLFAYTRRKPGNKP